jgi:hypothetical protein
VQFLQHNQQQGGHPQLGIRQRMAGQRMDGYNFQRLKTEILQRSSAPDWETAKKEWRLVQIIEAEEPETCLCGHHPVMEICTINNRLTEVSVDVGNVCAKRFLGFRSDLIFAAVKQLRLDDTKGLNDEAAAFFREQGVLNDWEYAFSADSARKRVLSSRQAVVRQRINAKVLRGIAQRGLK